MNIPKFNPLAIRSILMGFCLLVPSFLNQSVFLDQSVFLGQSVFFGQSVFAASASCADIESDLARLQCYDERDTRDVNATPDDSAPVITSQPVVRNPTTTAEPTPIAVSEPEPEVIERVVERIVYVDLPDAPLPEEIRSTIVDITEPPNRSRLGARKVFLLENGERWQESRNYGLKFEIGSDVYLKKGTFRGYNMTSGRNTVRVAKLN